MVTILGKLCINEMCIYEGIENFMNQKKVIAMRQPETKHKIHFLEWKAYENSLKFMKIP